MVRPCRFATVTFAATVINIAASAGAAPPLHPQLEALKDGEVNVHGSEVIKMWKAPMPRQDLTGAGFSEIAEARHSLVYAATRETGGYNHHAQIAVHNGTYYAMWSSNRRAEDAPGQRVLYATSPDGTSWTPHAELFAEPDEEQDWGGTGFLLAARAWVEVEGRLFGTAGLYETAGWENAEKTIVSDVRDPSQGVVFARKNHFGVIAREVLSDGSLGPIFSTHHVLPPKGAMNYEVSEHDAVVSHELNEAIRAKIYHKPINNGERPTSSDPTRLVEPSCYRLPDQSWVTLFRDDRYSHRLYVTTSTDDGQTWSEAQPTNIPDAPSFTKTLALEDEIVFMVGNQMAAPEQLDQPEPPHLGRDPLTLAISRDGGVTFTEAYALRSGKQQHRVEGIRGRGNTGAQYPALLVHDGELVVIYSMGKEDIYVAFVPLSAIGAD